MKGYTRILKNERIITQDASGKLSLVEGAKIGQASPDLSHWKVEMNPTDISEAAPSFKASPLDGNGQLYLCLQVNKKLLKKKACFSRKFSGFDNKKWAIPTAP